MANYEEIRKLMITGGLSDRVMVAALDVAVDVYKEDAGVENHANRVAWAANVLRDPHSKVMAILSGVLIDNKVANVEQILNASDVSIKSAVAELVDLFAGVESA